MSMSKRSIFSGGATLVLMVALVFVITGGDPGVAMTGTERQVAQSELEAIRAATERFRDVEVALEAGYIRDPFDHCVTAEMMGWPPEAGAMGVHYFRPELLGITEPPDPRVSGTGTHMDFLEPAILVYEPQANGSLDLVAVENLVFADAWRAAGHEEPPMFHGVSYDYMENDPETDADEAHMFEPHWDLHIWLYRDNPTGMFSPFNPNVSCEHHGGATHEH